MNDMQHDMLRQSLEMLGLPVVVPEPEVLKAEVANVQCKTLASMIADALEGDPMLRVQRDGTTVRVRVLGDSGTMTFTVEARP